MRSGILKFISNNFDLIYFTYFHVDLRRTGNSIGGVVEVVARNLPAGVGSPVFDKLEAELAKACMSLPASKGFEVGYNRLYLLSTKYIKS